MVFFSHFKASVTGSGDKPPGNKQFAPFFLSCEVLPRPTIFLISTDPGKVPPLLQEVPPATADPQIDLHRSG